VAVLTTRVVLIKVLVYERDLEQDEFTAPLREDAP